MRTQLPLPAASPQTSTSLATGSLGPRTTPASTHLLNIPAGHLPAARPTERALLPRPARHNQPNPLTTCIA
eukprot:9967760-Alexandrium_andersonii.AAC.1